MASRFQAVALVASPSYPNAIAWSDDNLIAVASGHLVTILNPALPFGPRGLITIPNAEAFPIGVIDRKELLSGRLLPTCLSRDRKPCVRAISWSPLGMAPNSGCLLAVCTTEGRVKLYRPPFCDFGAEWIEVMDISDRLYDYLASINFGVLEIPCPENSDEIEHRDADDLPNSVSKREHKRRNINKRFGTIGDQSSYPRDSDDSDAMSDPYVEQEGQGLDKESEINSDQLEEENLHQIVSVSKSKAKPRNTVQENCTLPQITADQYASRSAMLCSLAIAWSPLLHLSSKRCSVPQNGSSVSILALGGKSGKISLWRIYVPDCYSIEHSRIPTTAMLIGLLQAHNSWITTISWALLASDSSNPRVLLATGSFDGSVRIWLGNNDELVNSSEVNHTPLFLLKEVITADTVPVSVLSLSMPAKSPHKMLLAVGRGSGSFQVWNCDVSSGKFDNLGSYDAHDHVVMGLAWAFDGRCLYSCSQDNFVRSWILRGSSFCEIPIPSNSPHLRSSADLPDVFVACVGVAVSPGNLIVAMVRNLDLDLLHPMYQARAQKAVVEFFWIGGQQLDFFSNTSPLLDIGEFPDFSEKELTYWESNILWSLKQFEHPDKPLVVWDIIAALLAFKQSASKYVEHVLLKWLSFSFVGADMGHSAEKVLPQVSRSLSKIPSRQLHLLNIICRRVILSELKADQINSKVENLGGLCAAEGERLTFWLELLLCSERELRQRLVDFSFSAFLSLTGDSATTSQPGNWCPVGLAQMEQWVALDHDHVQDQVKVLASEVKKRERRLQCSEYVAAEQCSYCSVSVPFESAEVGFCRGLECTSETGRSHRLPRCAVSMQVCPTTPLWFCICCHRWAFRLAPETLFSMSGYPLDFKTSKESSVVEIASKPLCPFCGILLQRLQPDFLLCPSPV